MKIEVYEYTDEEALTAEDQLTVAHEQLEYMEDCAKKEYLSIAELIDIQSVYDLIKNNTY